MDFRHDAALEGFRSEVREFIGEHLPPDWATHSDDDGAYGARAIDDTRTFQRALAERQWLTMAWPREYGGLGASQWRQLVMNEEMAYHRAPGGNMGVMWVGPALLLYGSEAQKASTSARSPRPMSGGARSTRSRAPAATSPPCRPAPSPMATTT